MHHIEVAFKITVMMEEVNGVKYLWSADQFGRLATNILMLQNNGVIFDQPLIDAIATGNDKSHLIKELRKKSKLHYDLLDKVLDEIFEANKGV